MASTIDDDHDDDDDVDDVDEEDAGPADDVEAYLNSVDERLQALYDASLKPKVDALEAARVKMKRAVARGVAVLLGFVFLFIFSDVIRFAIAAVAGDSAIGRFIGDYAGLGLLLLLVAVGLVVVVRSARASAGSGAAFQAAFKRDLVADVVAHLLPDSTYQPDAHVPREIVEESGIFGRAFRLFTGSDLIRGRCDRVEFELSEIRIMGQGETGAASAIPKTISLTNFRGMFVQLGAARSVRGHVIVEPEEINGRASDHRPGFSRVDFDDPEFAEEFRVYATDPSEAQRLLTPAVRAGIRRIADEWLDLPLLAFTGNRVFFSVFQYGGTFRAIPTMSVSQSTVSSIGELLATVPLLIRAPGLLTDARGREATASILSHTPDRSVPGPFGGQNMPASDFLSLGATRADDVDLTLTPPPISRVSVSSAGDATEVTYGLTGGFWLRLLWVHVLTPLVAAGVARLMGEQGLAVLESILARLPFAQAAADVAAARPVVFGVLVLLFYAWQIWLILHIPRTVRIDNRGVHVRKLVWPIRSTYPFSEIEAFQVSERQVALKRTKGRGLARYVYPAPGMHTHEQARWLAAQLRRAAVMFGGLQGR